MLSQLHRNTHHIIHALFLEIQIFLIQKITDRKELSKKYVGNKFETSHSKEDLSLQV